MASQTEATTTAPTTTAGSPQRGPVNDNWKLPCDAQIPPMRSFEDFFTGYGSYRIPLGNMYEWNNRMVGNLLYYQTNYLALFVLAVVFALFRFPGDIVLGLSAAGLLVGVVLCSMSVSNRLFEFRREHPYATLGIIVVCVFLFIRFLPSLVHVVAFACFPLVAVILHCSLRIRDVGVSRNNVFVRQTVMAKLLQKLDIDLRQ